MEAAYLSAFSALAGSAIGATASLTTTWLTQRYQDRSQRLAQERARRERLFGEFIDQARSCTPTRSPIRRWRTQPGSSRSMPR